MTLTHYVLWIVLQAAATIVVLAVGTLGAADLLRRPDARRNATGPAATPLPATGDPARRDPAGEARRRAA